MKADSEFRTEAEWREQYPHATYCSWEQGSKKAVWVHRDGMYLTDTDFPSQSFGVVVLFKGGEQCLILPVPRPTRIKTAPGTVESVMKEALSR